MSISTGPAPTPPKKRGLGCLGCGCVVLVLVAVLFALVAVCIGYVGWKTVMTITTDTQPTIATFDGGDDAYAKVRAKLADFDHDVVNHQAATMSLSADEINTLIAHDPDVSRNHAQAFVTLTNSEARLQTSFPTDKVAYGIIKGRYVEIDVTFALRYDAGQRGVELTPHALQVGDRPLIGEGAPNDPATQQFIASFVPSFNQQFNAAIRKNADGAALLNQAKSIEIQNGQLVISTQ